MKKKCKVIMLPTSKANNALIMQMGSYKYFKEYFTQSYLRDINAASYHLYITSDDEIKEGDWVYNKVQKTVFKADASFMKLIGNSLSTNHKIIATTDTSLTTPYMTGKRQQEINGVPQVKPLPQLSQQLIQAYCNKPFDEIEVEYVYRGHFNMPSEHWDCILKTNQSNNIITSFIKDSYSREEVIGLFELLTYEMAQKIIGNRKSKYPYEHNIIPQDWIKENL